MSSLSQVALIASVLITSILPLKVFALTSSQVFDKVKDSIVVVKSLDAKGNMIGFGSGVLISPNRIATNCHIVKDGASCQAGRRNQFVSATLYAEDRDKDICILDAGGIAGKPVELGKSTGLKVGEAVYAVGAPQGLELSLSDGIVAQLRSGPPPLIQTTTAISPGSSGGGLFDSEGRLVGLTTLYLEGGQSLNFAVPVEWIPEVKPGQKLDIDKDGREAWVKRAAALERAQNWKEMLDWCQKWTKSLPADAVAWGILGDAYRNLARYDDAIDAYRQALRIKPDAHGIWINIGDAYSDLKRYTDAINAYRQILRIKPEDARAWLGLGLAYRNLERYNDAIDACRQALRINPEDADVWCYLGIAYDLSGDRTAALGVVKQLRRVDPAKADSLFNLIVPR